MGHWNSFPYGYPPDTEGMDGAGALWHSETTGWDVWSVRADELCYEGCFQKYTEQVMVCTQALFRTKLTEPTMWK